MVMYFLALSSLSSTITPVLTLSFPHSLCMVVIIPVVYNPSELRSDVTGKIVRFLQQDGDVVEKDKPYVEIEAMKMIMAVKG